MFLLHACYVGYAEPVLLSKNQLILARYRQLILLLSVQDVYFPAAVEQAVGAVVSLNLLGCLVTTLLAAYMDFHGITPLVHSYEQSVAGMTSVRSFVTATDAVYSRRTSYSSVLFVYHLCMT
jgi:hypothetical protein